MFRSDVNDDEINRIERKTTLLHPGINLFINRSGIAISCFNDIMKPFNFMTKQSNLIIKQAKIIKFS